MSSESRVIKAFEDVVGIEHAGVGQVRVHSVSGRSYLVDVRDGICECPDFAHNLQGRGRCGHLIAARLATNQVDLDVDIPTHHEVVADIHDREASRADSAAML